MVFGETRVRWSLTPWMYKKNTRFDLSENSPGLKQELSETFAQDA